MGHAESRGIQKETKKNASEDANNIVRVGGENKAQFEIGLNISDSLNQERKSATLDSD